MNTREQWIERRAAHLIATGSRDNALFLARAGADAHERLRGPNVADWPAPEEAGYVEQLRSGAAPEGEKTLSRALEARLVQEVNGLLQVHGDGLELDTLARVLARSAHSYGFGDDRAFMRAAIERAGFLLRGDRVYL